MKGRKGHCDRIQDEFLRSLSYIRMTSHLRAPTHPFALFIVFRSIKNPNTGLSGTPGRAGWDFLRVVCEDSLSQTAAESDSAVQSRLLRKPKNPTQN